MSLRDVKVGDEVVVAHHYRPHRVERAPVTAVGRKYITADGQRFAKEDGTLDGDSNIVTVHSLAEWAHKEACDAFRAAFLRIGNVRSFAHLSVDEVRDLTTTLRAVAEKMEKP